MKRWKKTLFGLLSGTMMLSMITPIAALGTQTNAENTKLKIASYNIAAKGNSTQKIGELVKKEGIDIVGFQEVDKNTGRNSKDMLKEIADEAGYDQYFRKNIDYSGGEYGIGMIANGTFANKDGANLETGSYEGRGWQRAEVTIDGKVIAVYNTHLTWESQPLRANQMKAILKVMDEDKTEYKVLTGNFYAEVRNNEFDAYLRDYNIVNGKDEKWLDTYIPSDASMKTNAIDNIIMTRNIQINDIEAYEATGIGSDHKILVASCELLEEEKTSTQLLDKQINKATSLLELTKIYTEETLKVLQTAIETTKNAKKDTQSDINKAIDDLNSAIDNLEKNPVARSEAVAWWDFDGEEPLKDKTGRGNDGVEKDTVAYVPGLENLGNALSTKDGYVSVAKATEDLKLGTQDFSVGFWYKATSPGSWAAVLGDKDWGSGANPGVAIVQGQGQFYTTYAANGKGQQENNAQGTAGMVYDGKWHYIAAVLDRDDKSLLYVDGKLIASTSIASTANDDATVTNPFNIGADGKGGYRINSLIDNVKVYRSVLSPEEIEEEYLLNCDKSSAAMEEMVKKTEDYLKDLVINPNEVTQLPTFKSENEKLISKIFCSENDQTINDKGEVLRQPLVDKKVQITYIVQENKAGVAYDEGTMIKNKWITVKGTKASGTNKMPDVVPTMQEWCGANGGTFSFNKDSRIVVPQQYKDVLNKAADITKSDIKELFGLDLQITNQSPQAGDLVLTFENGDAKLGEQGYALEIGEYATIRGTQYRGVFFGTRSLLQGMMTSGNKTIAQGTAIDYPNYQIRKFMVDVGRKYFPMWYLEDLMKYASWLKLTDFQCHLSEDTFNDYSAFRLESNIPNLTSEDGYYTKEEYRQFQKDAGDYGIRVITEIDGPAHARRFIELGQKEGAPDKYKNLGLDGTHFNLSEEGGARQRVLNLMDEVLEEYLGGDDPVIVTDAFNVGMDEYFGNQDDLRAYAVHMYDKVVNKYGKTAFGWDSNASLPNENYPKEMYPMEDIVIDYWKWEEVSGGMKKLMDAGYKVVNGDHRWYIVPGAQIGFYDYANEKRLYDELSAGNMVGWYGNGTIFPEGHPNIVGGNMLLWNDRGMFAGYTVNDIFARQRSQYPYLAQSYWYGREDESFEEFKEKVDTIEVGPGLNNLYKDIDSKGDVVYKFDMEELDGTTLKDQSDNHYNATVSGAKLTDGPNGKQLTFDGSGYIEAQHKALKWPYTAMFDLIIDKKQTGDIILFEEIMPKQGCVEKDGISRGQEKRSIVMKEQTDGTYRLTYSRENFNFEHNFTFKKGQPYRIAFSSDESKRTGGEYSKWNQPNTLHVNGQLVSTLQGPKKPDGFKGQWWVDTPSMNMPLEKIGQKLVGSIDNFQLYDHLLSNQEIADLGGFDDSEVEPEVKNVALNKPTTASSEKTSTQAAKFATDGDKDTRWGSNYNSNTNDPFDKVEWLSIDLQKSYNLGAVKLQWQAAYAEEYTIQVSDDGITYTDALKVTGGNGKEDILDLSGATGRYIRINCTKSVPSNDSSRWNYGYSLFEVEVYESETADKTALQDLYDTKDNYNQSYYVEETWDLFADALIYAKGVLDNQGATQVEVDEALDMLTKAIDNLELKKADYSQLEAAKKDIPEDLSKYTEESVKKLNDVLDSIEMDLDITNQTTVDGFVKALQDAIAGLKLIPSDAVNKDELKSLIDMCQKLDLGKYQDEGKAKFKQALAYAESIYEKADATIQEVEIARTQLLNAKYALKEIEISFDEDKIEMEIKDDNVKVSGVLPKGVKLSSKILNQDQMNELIKQIEKTNANFLKNAKLEKVFDLNLLLNEVKYNLDGTVKVTLKIDENFKGKNLGIVYIDDEGHVTKIKSTSDGKEITFDATHFSKYAIVSYEDQKDEGVSESVKTNDTSSMGIFVIMALGATLVAVVMTKRKKKDQE